MGRLRTTAVIACLLGAAAANAGKRKKANASSKWDGTYTGGAMGGDKYYCPSKVKELVVSGGKFSIPWTLLPVPNDDGETSGSPVTIGHIDGTIADDGTTTLDVKWEDPMPSGVAPGIKTETFAHLDTVISFTKDSFEKGKYGGLAAAFNSAVGRPLPRNVKAVQCYAGWKHTAYKQPPARGPSRHDQCASDCVKKWGYGPGADGCTKACP